MSATPELEANTSPPTLGDGDQTAAAFAHLERMQVSANPPQGNTLKQHPHIDPVPPAPLSNEVKGPPGPNASQVNGC